MTRDSAPPARHLDPYNQLDGYHFSYSQGHLWDRLIQPSFILSALLLLLAILYQSNRVNNSTLARYAASISDSIWYGLVYLIPGGLLFAIDRWLNPSLFPIPMLQSQTRTHASKSDVLKRLLGIDRPGGIMMSMSQTGRLSLPHLSGVGLFAKGIVDQPAGLGNWDNSCYQNSILQGLSALEPLPKYLAGPSQDGGDSAAKGCAADTLRELIAELNDFANNGKTLWTPAMLKNMSTWQQQDAQEYFSKLLDEIDKDIAKAVRAAQRPPGFETECVRDDSDVSQHSDDSGYQSLSNNSKAAAEPTFAGNPLEGLAAQRVACVSCGHSDGLSMIPFNCLTLNLDVISSQYDLYERLDSYTKVESIQGVECPKCTLLKYQRLIKIIIERSRTAGMKDEELQAPLTRLQVIEEALEDDDFDDKTLSGACKIPSNQRVTSTKTKQAVIARPPRSLAIHVNRSVFDEITGRSFKNPAAVRFPLTLDLGPWCLGSADESMSRRFPEQAKPAEEGSCGSDHEEEKWLLEPRASMVAGDHHRSKITGPIYELRAVVTHYGRHENGHYVCYRKHLRPVSKSNPSEAEDAKPVEAPPLLASEDIEESRDEVDEPGTEWKSPEADDAGSTGNAPLGAPEAQWWRLSDQDVTRSSEEDVLAQGGVFMLFYDCVDSRTAWNSESEVFVEAPLGEEADVDQRANEPADEGKGSEPSRRDEVERRESQTRLDCAEDVLLRAAATPLPGEDSQTELG